MRDELRDDTIGPYYPPSFLDGDRSDLSYIPGTVLRPEGDPVTLTGRVLDSNRAPVAPVLLEFWQADRFGRYRVPGGEAPDPWFEGVGRQYSVDGSYCLHTIRPGPIPATAGVKRAPHVTLTIFCDGISRVVTQIFFADEPDNEADPLLASLPAELRPRLIAAPTGSDTAAPIYALDIVMRGEGETPFFDDLED